MMKIERNNIYCGDAAELLEDLDPESIDLTVSSPPYDKLREYNGYTFDFERIARGLYRATKRGGVVVWVVSDETIDGSETLTSFRHALYFREIGFNVETMINERLSGGARGNNRLYWQAAEYMFILMKGKHKTANLIEDIKTTRPGRIYKVKQRNPEKAGSRVMKFKEFGRRSNVWRIGSGYNQFNNVKHPAKFPEALVRDHILSWSNPGDLVLDPMAGSGTTPKIAKETGRDWIAFDISPDYCEMIRERVSLAGPKKQKQAIKKTGNLTLPGLFE